MLMYSKSSHSLIHYSHSFVFQPIVDLFIMLQDDCDHNWKANYNEK